MSKKFMMLSAVCATIMLSPVLPVLADDPYCCFEYNQLVPYSNCCLTHKDCPTTGYTRVNPDSGSVRYNRCKAAAAEWCLSPKKTMVEKRKKGVLWKPY